MKFLKVKGAYDKVMEDMSQFMTGSNNDAWTPLKQGPTMDEIERQLHMDRIRHKIEQEMERKRQDQALKDAEEAKKWEELDRIRQEHRQREVQKQIDFANTIRAQVSQERQARRQALRKASVGLHRPPQGEWTEYD